MMPKKYIVELTPEERKKLIAVVSKGRNKALVIRRAHILLKSDEGKTDAEIAQMFYIDPDTVHRVRKSYSQLGLADTLTGKAYPEQEPLLDEKQEAYLIALACTEPPRGFARWTLVMLAKQLVKDDVVESISAESVRLVLKKTNLSLGA
jgi:transposase